MRDSDKQTARLITCELYNNQSTYRGLALQLHPKIWSTVVKCYDFVHGEEYLAKLLKMLLLSKQYIQDPQKYLYNQKVEFLKSLPFEDGLKVIKDVLEDEDIKELEISTWNENFENVNGWRPRIIAALESTGLTYNEEKRAFDVKGNGELRITAEPKEELVKSSFNDIFYTKLKKEINLCYSYKLYTASFILSRKMIENLVIDNLRLKYPANISGNLDIYYWQDPKGLKPGRLQDFSVLLMKLEEKKDEFLLDKDLVETFLSLVKPFRSKSNAKTHSIIMIADKDELRKSEIDQMVGLLLKLKYNLEHESKSAPISV